MALFLIVFQPFGTREFQFEHKYLFLAGYGVVIAAMLWLGSNVPLWLFPKQFEEERWTVGKQILFAALLFTFVFAACYAYKDLALGHPISWRGFFGFLPFAFSVAIFPIAGLVLVSYVYQLRHYSRLANEANVQIHAIPFSAVPKTAVLTDENGKAILELPPSQLLYLQAADNYVEVVYLENGQQPRRAILRNTLTVLETHLVEMGLCRCHRSYLVNLGQVERVSGNAQGYRLHFSNLDHSVPVARGRSAEILEKLR